MHTCKLICLEAALASQEPEEYIYHNIQYVKKTAKYLKIIITFTINFISKILNQKKETTKNSNIKKFLRATDIKTSTKTTNQILEKESPMPPKHLGELV